MNTFAYALELLEINKGYSNGGEQSEVVRNFSMQIARGEIVGLIGSSGAGKTTILQIAGLLDRPDSGKVIVEGTECSHLSEDELTAIRRQHVGYIYQSHCLIPELSILENVMLPLRIMGESKQTARQKAEHMLNQLGIYTSINKRPHEVSGGESQRAAIARAFVKHPTLLLADEPTGSLDDENAMNVLRMILALSREIGVATLIVTHNLALTQDCTRVIKLHTQLD